MATLTLQSTVPLNTNHKLPQLGFGVWDSPSHLTTQSCLTALKTGYRHLDTAQVYGNETEVGEAMKQSGLPREDIFVTTKVMSPEDDDAATYKKCLASVQKIAGDDGYVDLYLIHNVTCGAKGVKMLWQALEKLHKEGKAKSIGMSNTGIGIMEGMKTYAKVWPPAVDQLELHPWCQQRETVAYCQKSGIAVEAYCPLVRNQKADDPDLKAIAKTYGKSTVQVLIRYCLQKGWVPLPKSDNAGRIAENSELYDFELSSEEMKKLDDKDEGPKGSIVTTADNARTE